MRVAKKREILKCIKILKEVNIKIELMQLGSQNELLVQCQEMAIAVGNEIEKENSDSIIICYLEEYCEDLYRISICEKKNECVKISRHMEQLLRQIESCVNNEIKNDKYEIVFMPYKASMWDALDSVYREAVKAEDCNVVVMPVPYYNMNRKDGQVELNYEGNLFPQDIPITDFQKYSLEIMKPDVIFIHNPYDKYNHVTQLPEHYFSSNLVNYTEHLVYIPYFVTKGDSIREDHCIMPAIRNAWRTFVQSDAVRDCYIESGANPDKIVALGSPKFDMVVKMQENPPELPDEWKLALTGRKIFLLNTHLNPIINEAEKAIDKLYQIFQLFKERDDAALLWRPHPLSIETAKAMNPQILDKYMQVIEDFKELPNVVYDESVDVHRAIAISDAYVGDWSSLVTLYGITGKPVYITSVDAETNVTKKLEDKLFSFSCAAELDGYLWASADEFNGLVRIDMDTGKGEYVASFEKERLYEILLYKRVVAFDRKLFFVPYRASYIAEYNVDTGKFNYYGISKELKEQYVKFSSYIVRENKLYLFASRVLDILCLDMKTGTIEYCNWGYDTLPNEIKNDVRAMFVNIVDVGDIVYLPCLRTNIVIKIFLYDMKYEMVKVQEAKEGFVDITYSENNLYMLTVEGDVFTYDIRNGNTRLLWVNKYERLVDGKVAFYRIIYFKGFLWLLPGYGERICKIDVNTLQDYEIKDYPKDFSYDKNVKGTLYKWLNGEILNERLTLYPRKANMLLSWDGVSEETKGKVIDVHLGKVWIKSNMDENDNGYLYTEGVCSIEYYLDIVTKEADCYKTLRKDYFRNMQNNATGHCGEEIWKYIKDKL